MKINNIAKIAAAALIISSMTAALPLDVYAQTTSTASATQQSYDVKYGKVTSISSSKITVALGTVDESKGQGPQNGQMSAPPALPGNGNNSGIPPTPPDGMGNSSFGQMGTSPAAPDNMGTPPNGFGSNNTQPPEIPDMASSFKENGQTLTINISDVKITRMGQTASVSDISKGDIVTLVYNGNTISEVKIGIDPFGAGGNMPGGQKAPGGQTKSEITSKYTAYGKSKSASSKTLSSSSSDTSVILASNGGKFTVKNSTLKKAGDTTSEDGSNFYGLNAAAVAQANSTLIISGSKIYTDADSANAVFATGENAKVTVKNTTITTKENSSRGLDATLGGTINAQNVKITTSGAHCAALATDRGGGTVTARSSTLNTSGEGSPCIYSTGDITAVSCTGKATGAQIAVVEGKNTITLKNCKLTGAGSDGIMLYQSTSGDADVGTAVFRSSSSTLKSASSGPMFYVTNTDAVIELYNTKLSYRSGILLQASGNDGSRNWGKVGSNGGKVTLNAKKQVLKGDIICDSISSADISLSSSSSFTGAIDNANKGSVSVSLDSTSVWNVTADSYVSSISSAKSDFSNIKSNGYTIYYDSSVCTSLGGKTITLTDGGKLAPM